MVGAKGRKKKQLRREGIQGSPQRSDTAQQGGDGPSTQSTVAQGSSTASDVDNIALKARSLALEAQRWPAPPDVGSSGQKKEIITNYFKLKFGKDLILYQYSIDISCEGRRDSDIVGKKRVRLVELILRHDQITSLGTRVFSDFKTMILSTERFDTLEFQVPYSPEDGVEPGPNSARFNVKIQQCHRHEVGQLLAYLAGQGDCDNMGTIIQGLNVFLNHYTKTSQNLVTVGQNKTFDFGNNNNRRDLGGGIFAARGYFGSVRSGENDVLVNVNVRTSAFCRGQPLSDFFDVNRGRLSQIATLLKGCRVRQTKLLKRVKTFFNFAHRSDGQGSGNAPTVPKYGANANEVKFHYTYTVNEQTNETATEKVSVAEYYKRHYRPFALKYPHLPVVNVGDSSRPTYVPMELLNIEPNQLVRVKLNSRQTDEMIKFANRSPEANQSSIETEGRNVVGLNQNLNTSLKHVEIDADQELMRINSRILDCPNLEFSKPKGVKTLTNQNKASWNLKGRKFHSANKLENWACLEIWDEKNNPSGPVVGKARADTSLTKLHGILASHWPERVIAPARSVYNSCRIQGEDDKTALGEGLKANSHSRTGKRQILLIILPYKTSALYNNVKTIAERQVGIHTICCTAQKLLGAREDYWGNVALKFNLKLGGVNHIIDVPELTDLTGNAKSVLFKDKCNTMVVGIDVTHPSPGSSGNAPSIAAMVASTDKYLSQWPGIFKVQHKAKEEMVSCLKEMLESRLELWRKISGGGQTLPANILIYRDGVSEGQYELVLEKELPLLRLGWKAIYPKGVEPNVTLIIVGKRHNTRFFPLVPPQRLDARNNQGNVDPGTVVDTSITPRDYWDFVLQSHATVKGTGRPAHYFVLKDEIFSSSSSGNKVNASDALQKATFALCYAFTRATKAVSICAPAYYADLLCTRARAYKRDVFEVVADYELQDDPVNAGAGVNDNDIKIKDELMDTMFYI